jgi:hypothetical protein
MAIKRYVATKDNTITNAYMFNLVTRATGSNMGASDIVEVFSIYGQASSSTPANYGYSSEVARILMEFQVTGSESIKTDRDNGVLPASGNVSFYLRLFNARHSQTTPTNYQLAVEPLDAFWQEGPGLDMDGYTDTVHGNRGSTWVDANNEPTAATATVTVANEGWVEAGDTITLTATDGTEVVCTMHATTTTSTAQTTAVQAARNGASTSAVASEIATAINYSSYFSATAASNVVTITQATAGLAGNTTVTIVEGGATGFSKTNFTGGDGAWSSQGGDVLDDDGISSLFPKQKFKNGIEDLEVDITALVEYWLAGTQNNYGIRIKLDGSYEAYATGNTSGSQKSYFTKRFFGRNTEYFFKRPVIEARWESARRDDRGNFYYSSSLATRKDNLNTLYFYNYVRGQLKNIPGLDSTGKMYVSLYSGSENNSRPMPGSEALTLSIDTVYAGVDKMVVTGGLLPGKTGIYSASLAITAAVTGTTVVGPCTKLFDVWHNGSGSAQSGYLQFHTGTIRPKTLNASHYNPDYKYISRLRNLRPVYSNNETARFRLYAREKDWCPTIYNKATRDVESTLIDSASYKITRVIDGLEVIAHDTGSTNDAATQLSFDVSGNYFDLDMSMLEAGFSYEIGLAYYNGSIGSWVDQSEKFKFRVEQDEK